MNYTASSNGTGQIFAVDVESEGKNRRNIFSRVAKHRNLGKPTEAQDAKPLTRIGLASSSDGSSGQVISTSQLWGISWRYGRISTNL